MFERLLSRPIYLAAIVAVVAFIVYLQTLAPSVDWIDAGELATDCFTLGIAHPTGYPLFVLVGWVFSHLPIGSTVIFRLNIMAAFFTALGAGGVGLLTSELFQNWMPERVKKTVGKNVKGKAQPQKKGKGNNVASRSPRQAEVAVTSGSIAGVGAGTAPLHNIAAFATGIAAAFSATWWNQSTSIEVYPMHLFFVPLVLFFFLRMLRNEETEKVEMNGKLFALMLGLSFTNHMTTILLAPACLYMFFARYKISALAGKRIIRLAPFFIAALLLYGFMLIRSAQYPPMDWGHPSTLGALIRHVTAKQFQVWMYTGTGAAAKQWAYFWSRVPKEFTIVGAILGLFGLWKMLNAASVRRTHILAFTLLLFFGCLLYSINYDIHDIDSYFLLAFLAVALWIGAGVEMVSNWIAQSMKAQDSASSPNHPPTPALERRGSFIIVGIAVILGIIEIGANYSENDESGNYMVQDFTLNMLRNAPPHAIIFSSLWDFWVSGAFYYQLVEHVRPDVLVIDKAMLRDRPWYYAELEQRAPEVFNRVKVEENAFLPLLKAFDEGRPFDEAAIAPAYKSFTTALVEKNLDRPIFITQEMVDQRDDLFAPLMKIVPAGISYRMLPNDSLLGAAAPKETWNDTHYRQRDYYTDDARILQAMPLVSYAMTRLKQRDTVAAKQFLDDALLFTPDLSAKIEDLGDRDREIAEAANEKFTQIKAMRAQLH